MWRSSVAILLLTRAAMIIRSDCRGEPRNTSAPKRAISKREADIDIISIAQQARPNDIGQMEFLRAQLMALPSVVVNMSPDTRLSSKPASSMRANRSAGPLASGFSSILHIFSRTGGRNPALKRAAFFICVHLRSSAANVLDVVDGENFKKIGRR